MENLDESLLNKLVSNALSAAFKEFQKQPKNIKVANLIVSHDFLYSGSPVPTGMSYHIVSDVVVTLPLEAVKEETPK